jgi:hypothetical protein
MATSKMIEQASRGPYKPGVAPQVSGNDEVTLHMPRAAQDVEDAERLTSARQVVRMAYGRHTCRELPACEVHGRKRCDCNPCQDPRHPDDTALAADTVSALGLADVEVAGRGA